MAIKTRKQLSEEIGDLCDQAGCNDKVRKIHAAQYVDRSWNPHPPPKFVDWWAAGGALDTEKRTSNSWQDIDAVRAFNCEAVRETYFEAKKLGIAL